MSNDKESEQSSDIDLYDWFSVGDCLYEYECWRIYLVYGNIQPEFCRTISENRHKRGTVPGITRSAACFTRDYSYMCGNESRS